MFKIVSEYSSGLAVVYKTEKCKYTHYTYQKFKTIYVTCTISPNRAMRELE